MASESSRLLQLPPEVSTTIPPYLTNRDIKSLRLTCEALCAISPLRLDRVFLSANPRNIEVLRAVADHQVFRERVVEIIWDDARLKEGLIQRRSCDPQSAYFDPNLSGGFDVVDELDDDDELGCPEDDEYENEESDEDSDGEEQYPRWFFVGCKRSLEDMESHKGPKGMSQTTLPVQSWPTTCRSGNAHGDTIKSSSASKRRSWRQTPMKQLSSMGCSNSLPYGASPSLLQPTVSCSSRSMRRP